MDELQASFLFTRNLTYVSILLSSAAALTVVVRFFRREPSLDVVIQQVAEKFNAALTNYALSKDVVAGEERSGQELRRLRDDVASLKDRSATRDDMKAELNALETRIGGRIDGLHESLVEERRTARQQSQDFASAISSITTTTQHLHDAIKELKR